ncbi:MAG: RnfABCDGE type electron transport complex subunit D [Clostridiales bacterium]|jgi:electron transport complex protein RnfD|nr:RnfABCDGE type electron transport complex subunit D [Clostridiales bacterium]
MADNLVVSVSPHIRAKHTTRSIMARVLIALAPALVAAAVFFGASVVIQAALCVVFCAASEFLFGLFRVLAAKRKFGKADAKKSGMWDLSCAVTGLLLALNLPVFLKKGAGGAAYNMAGMFDFSHIDWGNMVFLCFVGSVVAIVLVKMAFGGIGKNFANPALTARIFLMLCFTSFMGAAVRNVMMPADVATGATFLGMGEAAPAAFRTDYLMMFLGVKNAAAVGEVSAAALLAGGVYLCVIKVIDWKLPLAVLLSAALFIFLFSGFKIELTLTHILSGGLFLGAIFMATDYSTSPNTFAGSMVYAVGIGFFVALLRFKSDYPEGVSFAIVIMNIVTPLIDKYIVPIPFGGRVKRAKKKPRAVNG